MFSEVDVEAVVIRLNRNKSGGHNNLSIEHLHRWMQEEYPIKELILPTYPDGENVQGIPTHVGVQHAPEINDLEHISPDP